MQLSLLKSLQSLWKRNPVLEKADPQSSRSDVDEHPQTIDLEIHPNDPLFAYLEKSSGTIDIEQLKMDSPMLNRMKAEGVKLAVPLVSQGELVGLISLGARRSEQDYTSEDRRLLNNLATQSAPALRVAQLAQQQQLEARERERMEHELRVARVIQETLLPKQIPNLSGYLISAHWQPARAVGGDFYDFFEFKDGRFGIVIADVTDKGVPAALVMATTRTILREAAEHLVMPGRVLERANELLVSDMPPNMFVTCLYILIDPASGLCLSANAGHNLPILSRKGWAEEIRVRGMPLGLISGMTYEEREVVIKPGESLLLYSDGLVEAHNPEGAMFESPRLIDLLKSGVRGSKQIQVSLKELAQFVGQDWEQEDDVTLVSLERLGEDLDMQHNMDLDDQMIKLAEFEVESIPGNEREVMNRVAEIVSPLGFSAERLEQLKTAVAETTMNAMEHGNQYREDLKVRIQIFKDVPMLVIRVRDHGGGKQIPDHVLPDLDAKIAGLQPPRGWGIFLIENMVDEMKVFSNDEYHTVELRMKLWE